MSNIRNYCVYPKCMGRVRCNCNDAGIFLPIKENEVQREFTQVDTSTNSFMEKGSWPTVNTSEPQKHWNLKLKKRKNKTIKKMKGLLYTIFCVLTAMIGYTIHGNLFYAVMDFFFAPIAWIYWLICHDVTLTVIKETFTWFFK